MESPTEHTHRVSAAPRIPDGPRSQKLDALLRQLGLSSDLVLNNREDMGEGDWVVARVSYEDAAGGYFAASMQKHPSGGLRDEVFTYGGRIPIQTWESGTEYIVKEPSPTPAEHAQVIIRRPDLVTLQITAGGRPGQNIPRPMSSDDLLDLARRADEALTNHEHP
jgi:hypothetical protein